ncbi:MAG: ArsR family transcriptional regulator [Bacteroidales bacterium]|nr:ArsR family transcriptional regulator [Bacteroidales bacterium]
MEPKEQVIKALKDSIEPLKSGDIAAITGLDKAIVDKQIKVLKTEGLIDSPKRCFYSPK